MKTIKTFLFFSSLILLLTSSSCETNDITEGWNGKHKNTLCQPSIYVYTVLIEDSEGKPIQKSGTVLLLK